jgi:hypothetical protein
MRGREKELGKKGRWGGAAGPIGPKGGARRGLGRPGSAHGAGEKEKEERKKREGEKKERKDLLHIFEIRSFYMNAFALSKQSKEMQGSAWCIKQHKVFRVFIRTGIPNRIPLRTLEKVKV